MRYVHRKRNEPPGEGRLARFCLIVGFACAPLCLPGKENNAVDNNRYYIERRRQRDTAKRPVVLYSTQHDQLRHGNTSRNHSELTTAIIGVRAHSVKKNVLRFTKFSSGVPGIRTFGRLASAGRLVTESSLCYHSCCTAGGVDTNMRP